MTETETNSNAKLTAAALRGYPDLMRVKDIQDVLQVGRSTAYKLLERGDIRSLRIGAAYRIPKKYLLEYLNKTA